MKTNIFIQVLLFLWQLPLNIIALIYRYVILGNRNVKSTALINNPKGFTKHVVYKSVCGGSISLGDYVFITNCTFGKAKSVTILHELGHTVQSMYLGPLYLIVIGIPSFVWAVLKRNRLFRLYTYHDFYTERWADNIAKVLR